jgi:hypothetical protein
MFGYKNFLMLGGDSPADIKSLTEGGYELANCRWGYKQGTDANGKATTAVHSGVIDVVLTQIPPTPVIEWALESRKYMDGMLVMLDANNMPVEKLIFQNATCTYFKIDYLQSGNSYLAVKLEITAEKLIVGDGEIIFTNNWVYD